MKDLLYCDLHATNVYPFNTKKISEEGVISYTRIEELYDTLDWIANNCDIKGISTAKNLGDTFHVANKFYVERFNTVVSKIINIHSKTTTGKGVMVKGNHDIDQSNDSCTIDIFKHLDNTLLVRDSAKIQFISEINSHFIYIPFIREKERIKKLFDSLYSKYKGVKNVYVFGHLDIKEAYEFDTGDEYNTYDDLHLEIFKAIFSGHLHTEKKIRDNMYYIGSCIALTFGDLEVEKYVKIVDFTPDGYTIESLANPYSPYFVKFDLDNKEEVIEKLKKARKIKTDNPNRNIYSRFYLKNNPTNRKTLEQLLDGTSHLFTFNEIKFIDEYETQEGLAKVDDFINSEINITDLIIKQATPKLQFHKHNVEEFVAKFREISNVN